LTYQDETTEDAPVISVAPLREAIAEAKKFGSSKLLAKLGEVAANVLDVLEVVAGGR
jgi:hypothetical protein